jgi:glutamyl-tRNA reductase
LETVINQSILFAIGINHKTAPVEFRERIYVQDVEIPALLAELKKTLDEAVVISTCNRIEIYGVTSNTDIDLDFYKDLVIDFKNAREFISRDDFFGMISCAACQQLFRVTTSLDSKIIGDMQILGQVRVSFQLA